MTTVAQVKQVLQPLLQRNSDLALVGRLVVIKPVHHILRGIYIDRMSNPVIFRPIWAVVFLFEPRQTFSFNWGERVYRRPGSWDVGDPDTPVAMAEAIEQQALPLLRPVQSIDNFIAFTSKDHFRDTYLDLYPDRRIFVDVARGDLEAARTSCAYFATDRAKRWYLPQMQEEYDRITKMLCPLVAANDRPGLARLLHDFEAGSAKDMKLNKVWEPTPFPIEML
jgi:hypothetical protein